MNELIIDNFAGGGGASTGIELALGRSPDIAINHSPVAVAMHTANHPATQHYCEDVWAVDPVMACAARPVGLAWFSPDCTHFSRAKGGKPRSKKIRGLAWIVLKWAKLVHPRVIVLENVEEFATWGPLDGDGRPVKTHTGATFKAWIEELQDFGYAVGWRSLVAADYGTPTTRRRLFLVARCDGESIVWPEPTHGKGRAQSWRTAAEIVDWSIPCPSIFTRRKPLAESTLQRIALGVQRYVLDAASPFIVSTPWACIDPPSRRSLGLGARKWMRAMRVCSVAARTVTSVGQEYGLVAALLTKHYTGVVGHDVARPLGTVTATDHHALTSAFLMKYCANSTGQDEHFGIVTIAGQDYVIVDIGMRMLQPRELFSAQGFPFGYVLDPEFKGKPITKTQQITLAGNSVCPQVAAALVAVNVGVTQRGCVRRWDESKSSFGKTHPPPKTVCE